MERDERRARRGASPDLPVHRRKPIHGGRFWARREPAAKVFSAGSVKDLAKDAISVGADLLSRNPPRRGGDDESHEFEQAPVAVPAPH
jgi:hypothetical protein